MWEVYGLPWRRVTVPVRAGLTYLNLLGRASSDVGDSPAGLFLDALFVAGLQQVEQAGQGCAIDDDLSLKVITSHNVAHCPQSWNQH